MKTLSQFLSESKDYYANKETGAIAKIVNAGYNQSLVKLPNGNKTVKPTKDLKKSGWVPFKVDEAVNYSNPFGGYSIQDHMDAAGHWAELAHDAEQRHDFKNAEKYKDSQRFHQTAAIHKASRLSEAEEGKTDILGLNADDYCDMAQEYHDKADEAEEDGDHDEAEEHREHAEYYNDEADELSGKQGYCDSRPLYERKLAVIREMFKNSDENKKNFKRIKQKDKSTSPVFDALRNIVPVPPGTPEYKEPGKFSLWKE